MRGKRHSLSNQIMGIQTPKKLHTEVLDYQKIIHKQQEVIKILQKQIHHLRQYILYIADYQKQESGLTQSKISTSSKQNKEYDNQDNQKQTEDSNNFEQVNKSNSINSKYQSNKKSGGIKGLMQQVMNIIQAKNLQQVLDKLKIMQEKANRKLEPVFIQRIKHKEVPVTVQVIKQVQKQIIVQRVIEKQKIVQVPVFKQKIVQRYINKPDDKNNDEESSLDISLDSNAVMKKKGPHYQEVKNNNNHNQTTRSIYREKKQFGSPMGSPVGNPVYSPRNGNHRNYRQGVNSKFTNWDKLKKSPRYAQKY